MEVIFRPSLRHCGAGQGKAGTHDWNCESGWGLPLGLGEGVALAWRLNYLNIESGLTGMWRFCI
jgi:hypothetical protein